MCSNTFVCDAVVTAFLSGPRISKYGRLRSLVQANWHVSLSSWVTDKLDKKSETTGDMCLCVPIVSEMCLLLFECLLLYSGFGVL